MLKRFSVCSGQVRPRGRIEFIIILDDESGIPFGNGDGDGQKVAETVRNDLVTGKAAVSQWCIAPLSKYKNLKPVSFAPPEPAPWIGVDLDGTLAEYTEWKGIAHIGAPVPAMVKRVKQWLREGKAVRIFTARVAPNPDGRDAIRTLHVIEDWCKKHIGQVLPVTCVKDFSMTELWDDRAVAVFQNTGRGLRFLPDGLVKLTDL